MTHVKGKGKGKGRVGRPKRSGSHSSRPRSASSRSGSQRRPKTVVVKEVVAAAPGPMETTGSTVGSYFGPMGARVGGGLGMLLGRIFGTGDYRTMGNARPNSNSLLTNGELSFGGAFSNSVRIRHREYVSEILLTSGSTTMTTWPINPGLPQTFPWLSSIAQNFVEYRIRGLLACFKSTSSDFPVGGASSALGSVAVAFSYNPAAPLPTSKMALLEMDWAVDSKPSLSFVAPMECKRGQNVVSNFLVRQATSSLPVSLTDQAQLIMCVTGTTASSGVIGELWLTYDIELVRPTIPAGLGLMSHVQSMPGAVVNGSQILGGTTLGNLVATAANGSDLGITSTYAAIYITGAPPGKYLFIYSAVGGSTACTLFPPNVFNGCALVGGFVADTVNSVTCPSVAVTTTTTVTCSFVVSNSSPSFSVTFPGGLVIPTGATADLYVFGLGVTMVA